MNILKYIITSKEIPVIFSMEIPHDNVLQNGISAGFLVLSYNNLTGKFRARCFGKSGSMNLQSMSKDVLLIENYLNNSFISMLQLPKRF